MKFKAFYRDDYYAETETQSMRKLRPVAEEVQRLGLAEITDGGSGEKVIPKLRKLHCPDFVKAFDEGDGFLASSQGWNWTPQIRNGVFAINQGMISATKAALKDGIAANIAQGFHHSGYSMGCGFCTFNGLALVAAENPRLKVAVLDCDQHGGNGTEEFIGRLKNLYQCTINGMSFGCEGGERSKVFTLRTAIRDNFAPYKKAMEKSFEHIKGWSPDLVIYQAGADPHENDPLGSLMMTAEQMRRRDVMAFEFCKREKLPVLFVLAGGYQQMRDLVPLHVQTFEEAARVYDTVNPDLS